MAGACRQYGVACGQSAVTRSTHAAKTMLPKLRIIVAAVLATCAAVLALSAGMLGARDPGDDLTGVPEISRTLVRQAIVAEPDRQQVQLLAYSRRADELLRLRDLPTTPARAVVDYAEHAQARAAETTSTAAPAATSPTNSVTAPAAAASEPEPAAAAPAPTATAEAPAAASATPPADAAPPATIAMAPVTNPHGDTTAAIPVPPAGPRSVTAAPDAAPANVATAPAADEAPAETAAPTASGDTQVAAVHPGGGATAEPYGPEKPKADAKPRHHTKVAHPHPSKPKKKIQVVVGNPRAPPTTSTGFAVNEPNNRNPVGQPNNRNTASGGWRNDSTAR
jgi:hypothetical protein